MTGIRALLLDFDGLLLDTESTLWSAHQAEFRRAGLRLEFAAYRRVSFGPVPLSPHDRVAALLRDGGSATVAGMAERIAAENRRLATMSRPTAGATELLAYADRAAWKVAVVSGSTRAWVTSHLSRIGIADRAQAIVCREDTPASKPDAAPYRHALSLLGVAAADAVALEDAPIGVASAKAAGLRCVAVPGPVTRGLDFAAADRICGDLRLAREWLGSTAAAAEPRTEMDGCLSCQ